MSTTLFFLVPLGMLGVAWAFCFIGCVFQTSGLAEPYSNEILQEPTLVAYWPLSDFPGVAPPTPPTPPGSTGVGTAADLSGNGHTGSYLIPPAYPMAQGSKQFTNPALTLRQGSIVPGDAVASGSKNLPASADFQGGYVSIPWSTQNSPQLSQFTLEAWIKPGWTGTGINWVVFSALLGSTGFSLFINDMNQWQINVGTGMAIVPDPSVTVDLTSPSYVAVTFDGQTLALWVNPSSEEDDQSNPPPPMATQTFPNTNYAPVDPTQPVTFFIGAGANDQPLRTPTANPMGAPLYPFQGLIQSVALYSSMLSPTDLGSHFENGSSGS